MLTYRIGGGEEPSHAPKFLLLPQAPFLIPWLSSSVCEAELSAKIAEITAYGVMEKAVVT